MASFTADEKGVVMACASCGQKNRTPYERIKDTGECGQCHAAIPPPSAPVDVSTQRAFDRLVAGASLPVVVDFWAPWCGPCRMVAPELEKVAMRGQGTVIVAKVNTEAAPDIGARFNVRSIPTMAVFIGGQERARTAGARPADAIEQFIQQAVQSASAGSASA